MRQHIGIKSQEKSEGDKKYYRVMAQTGHVGTGQSVDTSLFFEARNAVQAMQRAKHMPGVKTSKTPNVAEVTREEYEEGLAKNKEHGYLKTERIAKQKGEQAIKLKQEQWAGEAEQKVTDTAMQGLLAKYGSKYSNTTQVAGKYPSDQNPDQDNLS